MTRTFHQTGQDGLQQQATDQAQTIPIYAHNEESYIRDDYSCRRLLISIRIRILIHTTAQSRDVSNFNCPWPVGSIYIYKYA